jgi:hypothetical protein
MGYLNKEYSSSELNNLKQKAIDYCESKDSQFSFLGSAFKGVTKSVGRGVMNTASSGGKFLGSKRLGRMARNTVTSRAQRKMASGASGIIAKKAGLDKKDVSNVINSAGQLTGATGAIRRGIASGKAGEMAGKATMGALKTAQRASDYSKDLKSKAGDYAKQANQRMKNLTRNSTSPSNTSITG